MTDLAGIASLEEATVEASAVPEQADVDGWLVRWSPGKTKRARSVQAVSAGRLSLDVRLAEALAVFRAHRLPPLIRVSPVSQPTGLDTHLAALGQTRADETVVMVRALASADPRRSVSSLAPNVRPVSAHAHAAWVGRHRGSAPDAVRAHGERLARSPVPYRAFHVNGPDGSVVAGGQIAIDAKGRAGLYDVHVDPRFRRRGHARTICDALLAHASAAGASIAYLQVDVGNDAARSLYRDLQFVESHRYHYRQAPTPSDLG